MSLITMHVLTRCSLIMLTGCSVPSVTFTPDDVRDVEHPAARLLTVRCVGAGDGTVTSDLEGISCGPRCAASYIDRSTVQLSAHATSGSRFVGWLGGGCGETDACSVTMDADVEITATFALLPPQPPPSLFAVANAEANSVTVHAVTSDGDATPVRRIFGPRTLLVRPSGIDIAGDKIFVANQGDNSITVYPATADGDVAPLQRIAGDLTGIAQLTELMVSGDNIYLAQTNRIAVFPLGADGDVKPDRTITGLRPIDEMMVVGDELYVSERIANRITVLSVDTDGAAMPRRFIRGPTNRLRAPIGMVVHDGAIYVANTGRLEVLVFPQDARDNVDPTRAFSSTDTRHDPYQLIRIGTELVATSPNSSSVLVFPVAADGAVTPRRIAGSATGLGGPIGIAAF